MLGWPKRCKLAHAFLWENSCKRLKLAQVLGRHGIFLTWALQPSENALTPRWCISGTMPRVTPGTSRWLMTVLLALPNRASSACTYGNIRYSPQ